MDGFFLFVMSVFLGLSLTVSRKKIGFDTCAVRRTYTSEPLLGPEILHGLQVSRRGWHQSDGHNLILNRVSMPYWVTTALGRDPPPKEKTFTLSRKKMLDLFTRDKNGTLGAATAWSLTYNGRADFCGVEQISGNQG